MPATNNYNGYEIAQGVMLLMVFLPTVFIGSNACCFVPRKSDPARVWLTTLKIAFALFAADLFFWIVGNVLDLVYIYTETDPYDNLSSNTLVQILKAARQAYGTSEFLENLLHIVIVITFVFLSAGISIVRDGLERPHFKSIKILTYVSTGLIAILAIVEWGLFIKVRLDFGNGETSNTIQLWTSQQRIGFAITVLFVVISLFSTAEATSVRVKSNTADKPVKDAATYLLVSNLLFLLTTAYDMGSILSYENLQSAEFNSGEKSAILITDVILGEWPTFVILLLLYILSTRKQNGLWSTEQPFTTVNQVSPNDAPTQPTPWGYTYEQPPMQKEVPPQTHEMYGQSQPPAHEMYGQSQPTAHEMYGQSQPPAHEMYGQSPTLPRHEMYVPQNQQQQYQSQTGYLPLQPQPYQSPTTAHQELATPHGPNAPPGHDVAMGLNYQADGTTPQQQALPYDHKG